MKKISFFALFFLLSQNLFATTVDEERRLASEGLTLLLRRDYPAVERHVQEIIETDPQSLLGYLGFMAYSLVRNFENFDQRFDSYYDRWAPTGQDLAMKILNNEASDAWNLFLAGGILGLSGLHE